MILLLTDDTWGRLTSALVTSAEGRQLLAELRAGPELPSDRELIRMARHGDTPEAIARVRAQREAGIEAADQTRAAFDGLIRHVHGAGVQVATIARWFGVDRRRIYSALETELTESAVS